jgi:hypothetical protein
MNNAVIVVPAPEKPKDKKEDSKQNGEDEYNTFE